jgi:hypothetical protein
MSIVITSLRPDTWERVQMSLDAIQDRLRRVTSMLDRHDILYAVVGGNAIAAYVSQVDPMAVRATKDVDLMVRREDLDKIIQAAAAAGFYHTKTAGVDMLRDGEKGTARNAVHLVFENEKVRPHEPVSNPSINDSIVHPDGYRVLCLQGIVQIKLTAFRRHDQDHLIDLLKCRLIDETWVQRYPSPLSDKLQELCDLPEVKEYLESTEDEES